MCWVVETAEGAGERWIAVGEVNAVDFTVYILSTAALCNNYAQIGGGCTGGFVTAHNKITPNRHHMMKDGCFLI